MFTSDQYELLDFGSGRKLERFGDFVVDRPCPAAEEATKSSPEIWKQAIARYERTSDNQGKWLPENALPKTWSITHGELKFELKPTPFGHLGIFAEQAANWDWIARVVARANRPPKVLNLFAYTGGSTLAAAAVGAEVTHVDSAKNTVAWARRNTKISSLEEAPIRWITEDALKFVRREVKRGNRYDAVILDPPSYGHGVKGEPWHLATGLAELLTLCAELTSEGREFLLLTCHSPGFGPAEVSAYLADNIFGHCSAGVMARELTIQSADGRELPSGVVARWPESVL